MMLNLSYMKPAEIAGTIQVTRRVMRLGPLTDAHGKRWDVKGILNDTIQACPMDSLHPYYTDTSGASFGLVQQTWNPYAVEVVDPQAATEVE